MEKGGIAYRFATAFGVSPRFRMDLLINDFTYKIVDVRHLDIYEANAKRTFIHVADMVNAFLFGIENYDKMKGEAFNVGDECLNISKRAVAEKIIEKTKQMNGFEAYLFTENKEKRKDPDQRDYEVSYEKIQKVGKGFRTQVSLDQGLEELIKFYSFVKIRNPFSNV
jgi:nucleoside-diphosphate-sugar epimerase